MNHLVNQKACSRKTPADEQDIHIENVGDKDKNRTEAAKGQEEESGGEEGG